MNEDFTDLELRAVFECVVDGILIADPDTKKFVDANKTMCRMLGYGLSFRLSFC